MLNPHSVMYVIHTNMGNEGLDTDAAVLLGCASLIEIFTFEVNQFGNSEVLNVSLPNLQGCPIGV